MFLLDTNVISEFNRSGEPNPRVKQWLEATALQHDLTVVSRNVSDFSVVGLAVVNPWES